MIMLKKMPFLSSLSGLALLLAAPAFTWASSSAPAVPAERVALELGEGVKMEFVLIHPGSFTMGTTSHDYDEAPPHGVTLSQPFYLGKFEVTQAQWQRVMGDNPSHFKGPDRPVENVSWEDGQIFLAKLHAATGRNFALPTEAQWEYACRAGSKTEFCFGDDEAKLVDYGWFATNSELATHPVGKLKPNAWGLHDMHGNVYEWCADWYSEGSYPEGDAVDPVGPATGKRRTLRGGGWIFVGENLRCSDRGFSPPDYRASEYGLRCVMEVDGVPLRRAPSAVVAPKPEMDPAATLAARLDRAIAERDRLQAEFLVKEIEAASPQDPRVSSAREQIAALPIPPDTYMAELKNGAKMEFVLIRPGTFRMGASGAGVALDKPAHRVTISRPFYIGRYEVTQGQWLELMTQNRSGFRSDPGIATPENLPIDNVNWHLCQTFLARLNEQIPGRDFRLPTEAEWEYACRAGTTVDGVSDETLLREQAWFGANAGGRTHVVGGKKPNAWGVYDMYGNVWEWCSDWFAPYTSDSVWDPVGPKSPPPSGSRVLRGGAWNNTADHVNATFRHDVAADILMPYYGFRCVAAVKLDAPATAK